MAKHLRELITEIETREKHQIDPNSSEFILYRVELIYWNGPDCSLRVERDENQMKKLKELRDKYLDDGICVPIKKINGLGAQVEGGGFSEYVQLNSGIFLPESMAKEAELPFKPYEPAQIMTMEFN